MTTNLTVSENLKSLFLENKINVGIWEPNACWDFIVSVCHYINLALFKLWLFPSCERLFMKDL
jgi:hypothetical protein